MCKRYFYLFLILTGMVSCGDQPQLGDLVKDMVVQTNYETTADFNSYVTYTMPMDTIGLISNTSDNSAIVNSYSKMITANVKKKLDDTGYQYATLDQSPDLGVNIFVVKDLSIYQTVSYPYYGYPGYYGGFYGYGGYYNYPYVSTYVYDQAILVIELADLKMTENTNPKIIWTVNIGDLNTSVNPDAKVVEAIAQAFTQSPYLKHILR